MVRTSGLVFAQDSGSAALRAPSVVDGPVLMQMPSVSTSRGSPVLLVIPSAKLVLCPMKHVWRDALAELANELLCPNKGSSAQHACAMPAVAWNGSAGIDSFNGSEWTKAIFYRDPLDRMLDAYRSECTQGKGVVCSKLFGEAKASFKRVVSRLANQTARSIMAGEEAYDSYRSQHDLCLGGLPGGVHDHYNYAAQLTPQNARRIIGDLLRRVGVRQPEALAAFAHHFPPLNESQTVALARTAEARAQRYVTSKTLARSMLRFWAVDYRTFEMHVPAWAAAASGATWFEETGMQLQSVAEAMNLANARAATVDLHSVPCAPWCRNTNRTTLRARCADPSQSCAACAECATLGVHQLAASPRGPTCAMGNLHPHCHCSNGTEKETCSWAPYAKTDSKLHPPDAPSTDEEGCAGTASYLFLIGSEGVSSAAESAWSAYFDTCPVGSFTVHLHEQPSSHTAARLQELWAPGARLPDPVLGELRFSWRMQNASNKLYQAGLAQQTSSGCTPAWHHLLSVSTVPLVPCSEVHHFLASQQPRLSMMQARMCAPNECSCDENRPASMLESPGFMKSSQWSTLRREDVELVIDPALHGEWMDAYTPDEHFTANVLRRAGRPFLWQDMTKVSNMTCSGHPVTYECEDSHQLEEFRRFVAAAREEGKMFARKVGPACTEWLVTHGSTLRR